MNYVVYKFGRWRWAILDLDTHLLVRTPDKKIISFTSKQEAESYCKEIDRK